MDLLRSITALSNKAIENARISKFIRSSLEADISIHTKSKAILSTLTELTTSLPSNGCDLEFSLSDLFIVSNVSLCDVPLRVTDYPENIFSEARSVEWCGEEYVVEVVAGPTAASSGVRKCPRCWKWSCPEGEELCVRCEAVEQPRLKREGE